MLIVQLLNSLTRILDKSKHRREISLQVDEITSVRVVSCEISHQFDLIRLCLPQLLSLYHNLFSDLLDIII